MAAPTRATGYTTARRATLRPDRLAPTAVPPPHRLPPSTLPGYRAPRWSDLATFSRSSGFAESRRRRRCRRHRSLGRGRHADVRFGRRRRTGNGLAWKRRSRGGDGRRRCNVRGGLRADTRRCDARNGRVLYVDYRTASGGRTACHRGRGGAARASGRPDCIVVAAVACRGMSGRRATSQCGRERNDRKPGGEPRDRDEHASAPTLARDRSAEETRRAANVRESRDGETRSRGARRSRLRVARCGRARRRATAAPTAPPRAPPAGSPATVSLDTTNTPRRAGRGASAGVASAFHPSRRAFPPAPRSRGAPSGPRVARRARAPAAPSRDATSNRDSSAARRAPRRARHLRALRAC